MSPLLDQPIRAMAQLSHYIKRTSFPKKRADIIFLTKKRRLFLSFHISPTHLLSLSKNYTCTYNYLLHTRY
ncbi:hypothetical protein HanIR_Chr11g0507121 [Helianthus annuus]|nr:hypothetical protein HanIR_Chr11g0507121 [Helianthus annuus]